MLILQMLAAAGDDHASVADLAPPFVVRHVYSTGWVRATSNENFVLPQIVLLAYDFPRENEVSRKAV